MFAARDRGVSALREIDRALLDRNGDISIIPKETEGT
jgi:uncharacterized membrane protein YcaP (DUF421 family)